VTAAQFAAWLTLNLIPFSVIGGALVVAGLYYDRINTPTSRRIFCGLVVALAGSSALSAATVIYDTCTDPAIVGTWWWWAFGCYLR
jgi:hypothetical protein